VEVSVGGNGMGVGEGVSLGGRGVSEGTKVGVSLGRSVGVFVGLKLSACVRDNVGVSVGKVGTGMAVDGGGTGVAVTNTAIGVAVGTQEHKPQPIKASTSRGRTAACGKNDLVSTGWPQVGLPTVIMAPSYTSMRPW
jgi:hypothetical protein